MLQNLLAELNNGATESAGTVDRWRYQIHRVVLMNGATNSAEAISGMVLPNLQKLFGRGATKLHTVITQDWRYENCRPVLEEVL
jgi:hypothetical protein